MFHQTFGGRQHILFIIVYEAYSSNIIIDKLTARAAKRSQSLFKAYNYGYTFEDYYAHTLMIKGAMRSCIASRYLKRDIAFNKIVTTFLQLSLHAFNVDQTEIEKVIIRISEMDKEIVSIAEMLGAESLSI